MWIYKVTNKATGQYYIGQTIQLPKTRWKVHKKQLRNGYHHNPYLQNAWNKYGEDNFTFELVGIARHQLELNELEDLFIKYYNSIRPYGYNLKTGGDNPIYSIDTKKKLSKLRKGKKQSQETRDKIREATLRNYNDPAKRAEIMTKRNVAYERNRQEKALVKPTVLSDIERKEIWSTTLEKILLTRRKKMKGYSYCKFKNRWRAQIVIDGKKKHLGYYKTEKEARLVFNRFRKSLTTAKKTAKLLCFNE